MRWRLNALAIGSVLFLAASATAQEPTAPAEVQLPAPTVGEHAPSAPQAQPTAPGEVPAALPVVASGHADHSVQGEIAEHGADHAEGSHGEHGGFSAKTFALQLLNFGVLLFILIYFGGRAMNKALRARHEQLKNDIGESTRLRDEAKGKFQAQEKRIADLEKEIAALRASMRQDAEREQARMVEGAQEKAKRIQEELRFQLDQQVKDAETILRAEVATAAIKLADELLRKSVTPDDQRRLAQEFVAGFAGPGAPGGEAS
jgi:F-type H+-transporting ATPase subunit b